MNILIYILKKVIDCKYEKKITMKDHHKHFEGRSKEIQDIVEGRSN